MRGNVIASLMQTRCAHLRVSASSTATGKVGCCCSSGQFDLDGRQLSVPYGRQICPGQERSTSNQRRTQKHPPQSVLCFVGCERGQCWIFQSAFQIRRHKRSAIFFFFWKSCPISRPCCHFPQPRPSEPTTHRLKSYFNKPHNHKIIRSQLHY